MQNLLNKTALVTGGSRGIGAGIALALAEQGADIAISYEHAADRAATVVAQIEALGRRAVAIQADAADAGMPSQLVAQAVKELGGLDVLVNNAGIFRPSALRTATVTDIDALLHVNIRGVLLTTQAALPHLKSDGRVITIGSNLAERVPVPGMTLYAMTKSALLSFTRGLARASDVADGFDPELVMDAREVRRSDRFIHYAMGAAREALEQSGWSPEGHEERSRTATIIGTGVGGIPVVTAAANQIKTEGVRRLSPFMVPSFLSNLAAGQVAIRFGFHGPTGTPTTACAASAQAIGDAMRLIETGEADIALCGGTESSVDPVAIGGFTAAKALSFSFNDDPTRASRPFDANHDGFVLSEGAAMLVIERLSHAERRGARPLAILSGYGTTTDAHHVTAGWPDGREAARAMEIALTRAGISPTDLGYVNAHATSTPVGDAAELAALRRLFGSSIGNVPVGSTKSATGHMLGAAGAMEALFSVLAIDRGILPPSLNIERPMQGAEGIDLLNEGARNAAPIHVLSNAFGFGGVNAALVFSRHV